MGKCTVAPCIFAHISPFIDQGEASVESTIASVGWLSMYETLVRPSMERSLGASTSIGPGFGAVPGSGWGKRCASSGAV